MNRALLISLFLTGALWAEVIPPVVLTTPFSRTLLDDLDAGDARATVLAQKRHWIDVTEEPYNAPNNGTDDATAEVQAAEAAMSPGDVLYFPPGIYKMTSTLDCDQDGISLINDGTIHLAASSISVRISGHNSYVRGGKILGNVGGSQLGLYITGDGCEVDSVTVQGNGFLNGGIAYGIDVYGDTAFVHDCNVYEINSSGYSARGDNIIFQNCKAIDCGWDGFKGDNAGTLLTVRDCYVEHCGRSAFATDDADRVQLINLQILNPGDPALGQHHNVLHFESSTEVYIQGGFTRYDGEHAFCTTDDDQLAIWLGVSNCPNIIAEGHTVLWEDDFVCAVTPHVALVNVYQTSGKAKPLVLRNCNFDNRSKYHFQMNAQGDDIEIYDSRFFGGFYCYQSGAETTIRRFINNVVDGNNIDISDHDGFLGHQYGYEEDTVVQGNLFERINGNAIGGRWQDCSITNNTFQYNLCAIYLNDRYNDPAQDSDRTIIARNTFNYNTTLLRLADSTSAWDDKNMFLRNTVMGVHTYGVVGDGGSASLYWRDNVLAEGATITNLTSGSVGLTLYSDLTSQYDSRPLSILDFGADVAATDNASAIQAAIDAAELLGDCLYIPPGRFNIQSQLTITEPIVLYGASPGQKADTDRGSYLVKTADCNGIYVSAGATLRDFCVDSDGSDAASKCGIWVHVTDPSYRVYMENVRIINQTGNGLHLQVTNCGQFSNVHARHNGGAGIMLKADADLNCNANTFVNCLAYDNDANGVAIVTGYDNVFVGGEASSNNNATADGYYSNSYGNQFFGVYAEANGGDNFWLGTNAKASYVWLMNPGTVTGPTAESGINQVWHRRNLDYHFTQCLRPTRGISIGDNSEYPGYARFLEDSDDGSNYVQVQGQAMASNWTLTWPADDGDAGQALVTNGSGLTDWTSISGSVSDVEYGASWNGVTDVAASKNAIYDKIETMAGGHDAVTLAADADAVLGLSTQVIGLDVQNANKLFAGPTTGGDADPTFRTLVDNDVPDTITLTNLTQVTTRSHTSLSDIGSNTHTQIDTHLADTTDAHSVSSDTLTFTNKTLDADGTGNSITNIDEDNCKDASDLVTSGISFVIDGGGEAITTGIKGDVEIPFNCTLKSCRIVADQTGSIQIDIWMDSYANFPPDNSDSITDAGTTLAISSGIKAEDTTLTNWTKTFTKGNWLRYNVDSCSTIERATIALIMEK